jgi:hypothetical protein
MGANIIHCANGRMTETTTAETIDEMVAAACAHQGAGGIVIHFHGGLVNEAAGKAGAERLSSIYTDADAHSMFFVWRAGLLETIRYNVPEIAKEAVFKKLLERVLSIVSRKVSQGVQGRAVGDLSSGLDDDAVRDIVNKALGSADAVGAMDTDLGIALSGTLTELSTGEEAELLAELSINDHGLSDEFNAIAMELLPSSVVEEQMQARSASLVRASRKSLMDPEALEQVIDERESDTRGIISSLKAAKAVVKIAARVVLRFVKKRDHGIWVTIMEEVLREFYVGNAGGWVWSTMKQDTADAFKRPANAGSVFMDSLRKHWKGANKPKITLVGHSTGAVFIAHFLKHAGKEFTDEDVKFDVIFLAPAISYDLMADMVRDNENLIGGFRMFTMSDELERKDKLLWYLYPYSLLYFVSGVVEGHKWGDEPIFGMQRFMEHQRLSRDESKDVARVKEWMNGIADGAIWSVADEGPGKRTSDSKHGNFDGTQQDGDEESTMLSVQYILKNGF